MSKPNSIAYDKARGIAGAINQLILANIAFDHNPHAPAQKQANDRFDKLTEAIVKALDVEPTEKAVPADWQESTTYPTFNTRDMATLKAGNMYTLWFCAFLTGEITRVTGRLQMDGNLVEYDDGDTPVGMPIKEMYNWRVNCLKDELAAATDETTSTAVEVDRGQANHS